MPRSHPLPARLARSIAALALAATLWLSGSAASAQTLAVDLLDVGQGDAVLIRTPGGRAVLVDGGPRHGGVVAQLDSLGVERLHLVVATHPHADHIGGLVEVLRQLPVAAYIDNGDPHTTRTYRALMEALEASGVRRYRATRRTIRLGPGLALHLLGAPPDTEELNNRSVVMVADWGDFEMLLGGDAEVEQWRWLADQVPLPDVEVLKAAHHGSRNGYTPALLEAVRPEVVLIPVGRDNRYGHPHAGALAAYRQAADSVLRTDRQGRLSVRAAPDGRFTVSTSRGEAEGRRPDGGREGGGVDVRLRVRADAPGRDHTHLNGEYVELVNRGAAFSLAGWRICDAARHCHTFGERTLPAGRTLRLYTGRGRGRRGVAFMGSERAIWNNDGDVARLYRPDGSIAVTHRYGS